MAVSFIANALGGTTTTTSFSLTLPTTQADDILILEYGHRGTGDATLGGTYSGPAFTEKHDQQFATSTFSGKTLYSRCTGNHSGQTVTGSGLTNSCAAFITVYRGAKASGDPLAAATVVGEQNAAANETQAEITTTVDGAWVVLVVVNSPDLAVSTQACTSPGALTERAEVLSTGGTDFSIAHASAEKATAGATGAFTWAQTDAASGSWAYAIEPEPPPAAMPANNRTHAQPNYKERGYIDVLPNFALLMTAAAVTFVPRAGIYTQPAGRVGHETAAAPNLVINQQVGMPVRNQPVEGLAPRKYGDAPQNNLLTTLLAPTGTPFVPVQWPEPAQKILPGMVHTQQPQIVAAPQKPVFGRFQVEGKKYVYGYDQPRPNLNTTTLRPVSPKPSQRWIFDGPPKPKYGGIHWPPRRLAEESEPPAPPPVRPQIYEPPISSFVKQRPRRDDLQPINLTTSTLWIGGLRPDIYPEPTRRRTPGFLEPPLNRAVLTPPSLKPRTVPEFPTPSRKPRPFSTEQDVVQPIPLVETPRPRVRAALPEGKIQRKLDPLQPGYPLTLLFQQGQKPFVNVNWDNKSSTLRGWIEPQGMPLPTLGTAVGKPFIPYLEEQGRKPSGREVDATQLGTAITLLATPPRPFSNLSAFWPEGHGAKNLLGQVDLQAETNRTLLLPPGPEPPEPPLPPAGILRTAAMEEYQPSNKVADEAAMREFQRISQVLRQFSTKGMRVSHITPERPQLGDTFIADGTNWNPLGDGVRRPVWFDSAANEWKPMVPDDALAADVFTPTGFAVQNVDSFVMRQAFWQRVHNVVQVEGRVDINATSAAEVLFGLSLPLGSELTAIQHLSGQATGDTTPIQAAVIRADTVNNRAEMKYTAVDLSTVAWYYRYSYQVLS